MAHQKRKFAFSVALMTLAIGRALAAEGAPAGTTAIAQSDVEKAQITVAIPAQRLADSLRRLAEVSGLQLVYDAKIVEGKTSPAVAGTMTSRAALNTLLAGSGLGFQFSGDRTVILTASVGGVRAVGVVSVSGVNGANGLMPHGGAVSALNGVNGSRDVEATEATGSYTTGATSIVSKIPLTMREIAQSVSVMTAQQIKDQNLISARDVFEKIAGVSVAAGSTNEDFDIYSRGFKVNSFAFDGGAPTDTSQSGYRPVINLAEFDSVQLIRGAAGLFGGYADPGGVVNLVRKRPLDHEQFTYEQNIGSWQNYREVLDITGPLTQDRKLRGRAVYSQQDNKFFYDVAEAHKKVLYGVLEYDLTPKTLLTWGASYTRENNLPNNNGLPRYANGDAIDLPTSTCFCLPSASDKADKKEVFASLNHEFSSNLSAKINYTYIDTKYDSTYYGLQADKLVQGGNSAVRFAGFYSQTPQKQSALDVLTTGKFGLFGLEQSFVVGGNVQAVNTSGSSTTYVEDTVVPNVFNFDPYAYGAPAFSYPPYGEPDYIAKRNRSLQYGLYGNLRMAPIENLHVTVGMRYSALRQDLTAGYKNSPDQVYPQLKDRSRSKPNFGITYDFLGNFTVYGSYQATYQPQKYALSVKAAFIPPPITGVNEELGLKWQSTDKQLNAALSVYHITQKGFLSTDYSTIGSDGNATAYEKYVIQDYKSQGADLELAGQIFPGLQASINYSYNTSEVQTTYSTSPAPKASFLPRNIVKAWLTYRGAPDGPLDRVVIGGGVEVKSKGYTSGYVCAATNNAGDCTAYNPFDFKTSGYATWSAKVGYVFSKNIEGSLKLDNITNVKKYVANQYQSVNAYNFYVTPFSVMASLNAKF